MARWSWAFGLAGLVALVGSASTWFVTGSGEGPATGWALVGAALLIAYVVFDRDRVGDTVRSRSFLYGSGSSLMVALVVAICVGGYALARRHDHTWDLTTTKEFTLSDHAKSVLDGVETDVSVLAFYPSESPGQLEARRLLDRFTEHTDRVQVEFVDPLRNPLLAEQHDITGDHGTLVLSTADGRERRVETSPSEQKLTAALVLLLAETTHRICWSLGHGEPDPDDEFSDRGLGNAVLALEDMNYQVTKSIVARDGIERDCDALVVARPTDDWLPFEREALAGYVAEGGRVLVMLEPGEAPELAADLERYGVIVGDDVVLDVNPRNQFMGVDDPSFVVLYDDNRVDHPVTRSLYAAVVLGVTRSVAAVQAAEGVTVRELLHTSAEAWAESDIDGMEVGPDPETERVGDVPVGVVSVVDDPSVLAVALPEVPAPVEAVEPVEADAPVEAEPSDPAGAPAEIDLESDEGRAVPADLAPEAGGRLIVLGDSDFANNQLLTLGNNRDLFLNSIAWLVDEEAQIGARPEDGDMLELTELDEALLCLVSVFLVPGGAMALGLLALVRRRFL